MRRDQNRRPLSLAASRPPSLVSDHSPTSRSSSLNFEDSDCSNSPLAFPTSATKTKEHAARPKHLLMRSRRTSLPAVPTLSPGDRSHLAATPTRPSGNRFSTASATSFDSLAEGVEQVTFSPAPVASTSANPMSTSSLSASTDTKTLHRLSLPPPKMRRSHSTPVKPLTHPTRFAPEPVAPAEDPSQQQRRTQKRQNLIQELVDTEDAYVKSLTDIDEYFLQPLLHSVDSSGAFSAPLLDRKAISEIFSNFSDVLTLNKEILRRLQDGAGTPTSEVEREFSQEAAFQAAAVAHDDPGNLLLPLCPFLRCYKMFIQNFSRSLERLLREERESDRWRGFLESRAKIGKGKGLGLSGMLLGIVQRIPRYRMLLSSIVELTMPDHRDFTDLAKACAIVTEVADSVDDAVRQHEDTQRVLELQRSFTNLDAPLIAPGRRLIKCGSLLKTCRKDEQIRTFFLFSDLIVYGVLFESSSGWTRAMSMTGLTSSLIGTNGQPNSMDKESKRLSTHSLVAPSMSRSASSRSCASSIPSEAQYQLHRRMPLKDITVVGIEGTYFEIRSSEKSFAVAADDMESKIEWMNAIRAAKDELMSKRVTLYTDTIKHTRTRSNSFPRQGPRPIPSFSFEPMASPISEEVPSLTPSPAPSRQPSVFATPPKATEEQVTPIVATDTTSPGPVDKPIASESFVQDTFPVAHNYSAPVWIPDAKASRCMSCQGAFSWIRRKHHCRLCGQVVCWSCSGKTFIIPGILHAKDDQRSRACDRCFTSCFTANETGPENTSVDSQRTFDYITSALRDSQGSNPT